MPEIKDDVVLKRFIILPYQVTRHLFLMNPQLTLVKLDEEPSPFGPAPIYAIYKPTGRGPFMLEKGKKVYGWEYEYEGVCVGG